MEFSYTSTETFKSSEVVTRLDGSQETLYEKSRTEKRHPLFTVYEDRVTLLHIPGTRVSRLVLPTTLGTVVMVVILGILLGTLSSVFSHSGQPISHISHRTSL